MLYFLALIFRSIWGCIEVQAQGIACFFDRKVVHRKVVISCSKSYESSVLNFRDLRKFTDVDVLGI